MDLDTYLATHRASWERLASLTDGGRRGVKRMDESQVTEMVGLYQQTSANLSYVRTYYRDPGLTAHLTTLVSNSGSIIYGTRPRTWRALAEFFTISFPAAMYRTRWFIAISALLLLVPALISGVWIANSDEARNAAIPLALQDSYVNEEFESYYESENAAQFGADVFVNNAQVAIIAFASGLLLGIPTIFIMISNGANLGFAGGLFAHYGQLDRFFGLILPHGLLELTAVVVAGATGLYMGWCIIAPGDRSRDVALREEGRRVVTVVLGLVVTLFISGVIEGFVSGQPWPTWIRVGIGVIAEALFLAYFFILGRRAMRMGYTGAIGETDDRGWAKQATVAT